MEEEEPVGPGRVGIHAARDDPRRNVVHYDEAIEQPRMVLCEPCRDPGASVVPDKRDPADFKFFQELEQVERHGPLVVARSGLVRFAVSPQIRRYNAITRCERRNLMPPGKAGFRKAVEKDDGRAGAGVHIMLTNSVCMNSMMTNVHSGCPWRRPSVRRPGDVQLSREARTVLSNGTLIC
jgi:hypothetical protein